MRLACESLKWGDGLPCKSAAAWVVRVGARETDQQLSCGTHLSFVCSAMYEAEGRRGAELTVRPAVLHD